MLDRVVRRLFLGRDRDTFDVRHIETLVRKLSSEWEVVVLKLDAEGWIKRVWLYLLLCCEGVPSSSKRYGVCYQRPIIGTPHACS